MPVIDDQGRVLRLVNIVDLLVVLLGVAVFAAVSALTLPRGLAGLLTAIVAVVSLVGLVNLSLWRFDVAWSEVWAAAKDAWPSWPSRPFLRGGWHWFTAEPEPEVIVIDLRETLTVGPVIIVIDWLSSNLAAAYRGSVLDRSLSWLPGGLASLGKRTKLSRVAAVAARFLAPPEPPDKE